MFSLRLQIVSVLLAVVSVSAPTSVTLFHCDRHAETHGERCDDEPVRPCCKQHVSSEAASVLSAPPCCRPDTREAGETEGGFAEVAPLATALVGVADIGTRIRPPAAVTSNGLAETSMDWSPPVRRHLFLCVQLT